jgi:RNA polymerase sigma factor (TIGR02999 family)
LGTAVDWRDAVFVTKQRSRRANGIMNDDPRPADQLVPLVYEELRRLAARKLAHEAPGQTLDATALVHEAYLRLCGDRPEQPWDNRGHFLAAAAEAMRRILIESARHKSRLKHGGGRRRVELPDDGPAVDSSPDELLALDHALTKLAAEDAAAAEIVKLRYFAGLSIEEAAAALGVSRATAYRHWTYARAWLRCAVEGEGEAAPPPAE